MTDAQMMAQIRTDFGDYIAGAVEGTPFPPALLGAIVANESSGNPRVTRFEPAIFAELARVATGQKLSYSPAGIRAPLLAAQIVSKIAPLHVLASGQQPQPVLPFSSSLLMLINYSTSWGPTQIMGWHAIEFDFPVSDISNIQTHFERTVQLLTWFYDRYGIEALSPAAAMAALLHCWNTGSPTAPTFDPGYAAKGLARARLYDAAA